MIDSTINNAIGLLEECITNGESGKDVLYAWFLGEQVLINNIIKELTAEETRLEIKPSKLSEESDEQINAIIEALENNEDKLSDGYEYYCYTSRPVNTPDEYKTIEVNDVLKKVAIDILRNLSKIIHNIKET